MPRLEGIIFYEEIVFEVVLGRFSCTTLKTVNPFDGIRTDLNDEYGAMKVRNWKQVFFPEIFHPAW